jgi:hypothetical protein
MSDWFSFWGGKQESDTTNLSTTLSTTRDIRKANAQFQVAKGAIGAVEGLTGLMNIPLYKKERDNAIMAIENNVLAGQDAIIRELSYNTDQALTYAARGNVSISSPVIMERMKRGAKEAGYDFAMLRANADIQKANADIQYSAKRRKTFSNALQGVMGALMTYGAFGSSLGGDVAVDPMQVSSANNRL